MAAAQGRPKQGRAPSGGSDPRSGGAWGHYFPQSCSRRASRPQLVR